MKDSLALLHPQADSVGQTPRSAADPLGGLPGLSKSRTRGSGADRGVRPTFVCCCPVGQKGAT